MMPDFLPPEPASGAQYRPLADGEDESPGEHEMRHERSSILRAPGLDARGIAAARKASPSRRYKVPNLASQIWMAFESRASNTGPSSPGELEMTCRTSEVAVCCCSDSR